MAKKVTPPDKTPRGAKVMAYFLILIGVLLLLYSIYIVYRNYAPPIPSKRVSPPQSVKVIDNTNSQEIYVEGKASPNSRVLFFENGKKIAEAKADDTGIFSSTIILKEGKHQIDVKTVVNKVLNFISKDSQKIQVTVDTTKPEIKDLKYPKQVKGDTLTIEGKLSEEATLIIQAGSNRIFEKELPKGKFLVKVNLKGIKSKNLYIFAIDKAGNTSTAIKLDVKIASKLTTHKKSVKTGKLPNSAGPKDVIQFFSTNKIAIWTSTLIITTYLTSFALIKYIKRD